MDARWPLHFRREILVRWMRVRLWAYRTGFPPSHYDHRYAEKEGYYHPFQTDWFELWEHTLSAEAALVFPCSYVIHPFLSPSQEKIDNCITLFSHRSALSRIAPIHEELTGPWVSCVHWEYELSCVNHSWTWHLPPGCQEEESGVSFPLLVLSLHQKEWVVHSVNIYYKGPLWEEAILKLHQVPLTPKGSRQDAQGHLGGAVQWGERRGAQRGARVGISLQSRVLFKPSSQIWKIPLYNTSILF